MKILLTDIFYRKTFDVINILKSHFTIDNFIFTLPTNSKQNAFKLKRIYEINNFEILNNESFDNDLLQISKRYEKEEIIYLPIEESTTFNFLKFIEVNDELNFKYLLPSLTNFQLSRHKEQLNLYCERNNISCPKYISKAVLKSKQFQFPIIKKPSLGSGANGIVYIESEEGLNKCIINFDTDFVQERLPNPKDVEAGFYLCKNGEIVSFYSHKRIRTYPEIGGVTIFSKSECNQNIKTLGSQVLKELNWSGFVMIEFIFDKRDGLYKLIEINPRLWGSIMLSEFCNANFLVNYVDGCLGNKFIEPNVDTEKYIRWVFPYDILYWIKYYPNPFIFFRKKRNTCYINFSYSTPWRSLQFVVLSYFDFKKITSIFKNG